MPGLISKKGSNGKRPSYYITARYFVDNRFWVPQRKDYIAAIVLKLLLGAVILTRDLKGFRAVISADLGLWENSFLAT